MLDYQNWKYFILYSPKRSEIRLAIFLPCNLLTKEMSLHLTIAARKRINLPSLIRGIKTPLTSVALEQAQYPRDSRFSTLFQPFVFFPWQLIRCSEIQKRRSNGIGGYCYRKQRAANMTPFCSHDSARNCFGTMTSQRTSLPDSLWTVISQMTMCTEAKESRYQGCSS